MLVNALGPDEYCDGVDTCSARDADGHGTHTATTAAGSPVDHAALNGTDPATSTASPRARPSSDTASAARTGCYNTDSMAAVEQAIMDDVDVINFSISGAPTLTPMAWRWLSWMRTPRAIMVNASAGNSGPAGTTDHGGPWVNTVGASTLNRAFLTTLHLTADGGATLDVSGATVSGGVSTPTPVVLGADTVSGCCATRRPRPVLHRRSRGVQARRQPRREGLPRLPGRCRRHDPVQPSPNRRRDGQPLPARDPRQRPPGPPPS